MIKINMINDKISKAILQERMDAESLKAKTDEQKKLSKERVAKIINNKNHTPNKCMDWNIHHASRNEEDYIVVSLLGYVDKTMFWPDSVQEFGHNCNVSDICVGNI